jgi:predicted unusual protein kinase regulating ubiquinone biosynthesis (AarF/ABC1/UbiB family)
MVRNDMTDDRANDKGQAPTATPTSSRFQRFARMTGLTAGVTARHLGQKVAGVFQSDAQKSASMTESQRKSAQHITKTLGELKGAAMKIGQMMATDPELLPPEMVKEISQLQHSAPAMAFDDVKAVVEGALQAPIEAHFTSFSKEPIGAASIGQVHRATLLDGQDVAVKVQYPGIADTIASDMGNLGTLLSVLRLQLPKERLDAYLGELTAVIQAESDYLQEANNLERFCTILRDMPGIRVPTPIHELTRPNVLVMEFLQGTRLERWLEAAPQAQRDIQGHRLLDVFLQSVHRNQVLHADPHPGNFLVLDGPDVDGAPPLGILDAGCVRVFDVAFTDALVAFVAAMWKSDLQALKAAWEKVGFIDHDVDPELIFEWNELILAPLLHDGPWDFGAWKIQEQAVKFMMAHPSVKLWSPPREVLFYLRTLVGLRGLLAKTGIRVDVRRMARTMAVERGALKRA